MNTDDCKKFLAGFFTRNLTIIPAYISRDDPDLAATVKDARTVKKWKRRYKCKPGSGDYDFRYYILYTENGTVTRYGEPTLNIHRKPSEFVSERGFELDGTEGAIAFVVLEKADGTLHLGDYIGD
jgi:hypothetical protein